MEKRILSTIDCAGFLLRRWHKKDINSLVANANNKNVWINLKDVFPFPYTKEEAKKWIEMTKTFPANTNFAIDIAGKAVGGIGVHFFNDVHSHSAELGYWLGESYWGRGITTEAVGKVSKFIFDNFNITRIFARVFEWNISSMRVLEKNGFICEGRLRKQVFKNGIYADEFIYGLLKNNE